MIYISAEIDKKKADDNLLLLAGPRFLIASNDHPLPTAHLFSHPPLHYYRPCSLSLILPALVTIEREREFFTLMRPGGAGI